MKKVAAILSIIMMMLWSQCASADMESIVLELLEQELSDFMRSEDTQEIPIYSALNSDAPYMLIYCGTSNQSQKVMGTSLIVHQDWKQDWDWNAFEAGERAVNQFGELFGICKMMQGLGRNVPIQVDTYEEYSERNGGYTNLIGIDSLYIHSDAQTSYGNMKWEVYPFCLIDGDIIFEGAVYIYCRMVISLDEQGEQIEHFFIADQKRVAEILQQLLRLNLNIDARDDVIIRNFIQIQESSDTPKTSEITEKPSYNYEVKQDEAGQQYLAITGYTGPKDADLDIPAQINGIPVREIADGAFQMQDELTGKLIIPDGVTRIGERAFNCCSSLTGDLIIPDSVTSIGMYAFHGCSNLTGSLKIPNGVTSIEFSAFYDCNGLTGDLKIPESVTCIEARAFAGCNGLTGELTIPDGVTSIGDYAFSYCTSLTGDLKIPDGVTSIGDGAFLNCCGLKGQLLIPKSVTSIEPDAFEMCSFTEIIDYSGLYAPMSTLTPTVTPSPAPTPTPVPTPMPTKIPMTYKALEAKKSVSGDYEYANMGDGTCVITDWNGNKSNLKIPNQLNGKKVVGIGYEAFTEYNRRPTVTSVTIPEGVTVIGQHSFYYCSELKQVTIPESVTTIERSAFDSCTALESVTIPKNVTLVGANAFAGCDNLTSVTFDSANVVFESDSFSQSVFEQCDRLEEIRGVAGSSAETLANELGVRFVALSDEYLKALNEYERGDYGDEVLRIKARLQELGYYSESAEFDAEFNDIMVSRVKQYQRDHGLEQTGRVDEHTYRSLMPSSNNDASFAAKQKTATPKPTSAPAPTPTPTSSPMATFNAQKISRTFEIDPNIQFDKGNVTLKWTDSENEAPYVVTYQYYDPDAQVGQTSFWPGTKETATTNSKSFTFDNLIPGKQYVFRIEDANGVVISKVIKLPDAEEFSDNSLKAKSVRVTVLPRYRVNSDVAYGGAKKPDKFYAKEMMENMKKGYLYGLEVTFNFPTLSSKRTYQTTIAYYAPNGYVFSEYLGETETQSGGWFQWFCAGDYFFELLNEKTGSIPTGTYQIELYWDGMLVSTKHFSVQ